MSRLNPNAASFISNRHTPKAISGFMKQSWMKDYPWIPQPPEEPVEEIQEEEPEMVIIVPPKEGELAPPSVQNMPGYERPDAIVVPKTGDISEMQAKLNEVHLNLTDDEERKFSAVPPPPQLQETTAPTIAGAGFGYSTERHEELLQPTPGTSGRAISSFFQHLPQSIKGPSPRDSNGFIALKDLPEIPWNQRWRDADKPDVHNLGKSMSDYFSNQKDSSTDLIPRLGRAGLGVAKSIGFGASNALINAGVRGAFNLAEKILKPRDPEPPKEDFLQSMSRQMPANNLARRGAQMF